MWPNSVFSVFKNLRRAGVLKNKSRTSTVVPRGCADASIEGAISRPSTDTLEPASPSTAEIRSNRETEAMDARASPRKPRVLTASRSSRSKILLVACRDNASGNSSDRIPDPLSRMRILPIPPASQSISICVEPASNAFSTSSFTTLAGRSTTSPAAIWFASRGERMWIDELDFINLHVCETHHRLSNFMSARPISLRTLSLCFS
jgi:hypothetical protein